MGMSEAALRKAVERLRLRYQELFRQEIVQTVTSPAEVEDELRHLQTVMRGERLAKSFHGSPTHRTALSSVYKSTVAERRWVVSRCDKPGPCPAGDWKWEKRPSVRAPLNAVSCRSATRSTLLLTPRPR